MFLSRSALKDVLFLTLTIGTLFTFMLGSRPLSAPDEGRYTEIPREMVASDDFMTPRLNGVKYFEKPPLMYWLASASIKSFGVNEWALRFWTALLGLLTCLMAYGTGRALYGRRAGLFSGGILSTSLLFYAHTRILILDMAVSTFIVGGIFSFLLATREKATREKKSLRQYFYLCSFFVFSALAVLSKGLIGAVLPGASILLWCALRRDGKSLLLAFKPWGIALFFLIAAPWHIVVSLKNPEFFNFYFIYEHFERFLTTAHSRYQPFWFFMPIVLLGFFPWTGLFVKTIISTVKLIRNSLDREREAFFLLLSAGFIFTFFSLSSSKLIPYIVPVFPLMAVLMGRHLDDMWDKGKPVLWGSFVGIALLLSAAIPIALWHQGLFGNTALKPYWITVVMVLLSGSAYVFLQRQNMNRTFGGILVTGTLMLGILNGAWPCLDHRSVKELALEINKHKQPGDQIVAFGRYYQDLPPYVDQKIIVTDWKGELEFGMGVEDTSDWMMTRGAFVERYKKGGRFFVVTRKEFLPDLINAGIPGERIERLLETSKDVLLKLEPQEDSLPPINTPINTSNTPINPINPVNPVNPMNTAERAS